ncbi:MAG: MBL fold metallo-hydrolase [Pseudomonadota bacterium]
MAEITTTFIGSGDAFGSGGRLQTCILVDTPDLRFTVDFGTTSLAGLRQQQIDLNSINAVFLTHLHGDHCGGLPFLLLDAMLGARRTAPLTIVGPASVEHHIAQLQSVLFPGSEIMQPSFQLKYVTLTPDQEYELAGLKLRTIAARHTKQTNPLAMRMEIGDKSIVFTGDGELTPDLIQLVENADLLIAECYFYSKAVKWHLNYPDIAALSSARQIVLTHMHTDMLANTERVKEICAYDGYQITI